VEEGNQSQEAVAPLLGIRLEEEEGIGSWEEVPRGEEMGDHLVEETEDPMEDLARQGMVALAFLVRRVLKLLVWGGKHRVEAPYEVSFLACLAYLAYQMAEVEHL